MLLVARVAFNFLNVMAVIGVPHYELTQIGGTILE
jgi:hypothetical protein